MEHLKRAEADAEKEDLKVREAVEIMIANIREQGENAVRSYAREFDGWEGDFALGSEKKAALIAEVSEREKEDIRFAHAQVKRFAEAQRQSISEFDIETEPGVRLGQRIVPVECAGCYVPGGRYAHVASAIMSITTALPSFRFHRPENTGET